MPADRVPPWTVKQYSFISWWDHWGSASLDSAIGTWFYKLPLVFALSYRLHTSKCYMPSFVNHRNHNRTAPISLYFARFSSLGKPVLVYTSEVNTYVTPNKIVCSTSLTSFVHIFLGFFMDLRWPRAFLRFNAGLVISYLYPSCPYELMKYKRGVTHGRQQPKYIIVHFFLTKSHICTVNCTIPSRNSSKHDNFTPIILQLLLSGGTYYRCIV